MGKAKKILNIEAGLEMIALAMAICSEVGFLPIMRVFSLNILTHIFSIRIAGCFLNCLQTLTKCSGGSNIALFL